ncbi:LacI family DNA-binding transcriptional regulator [Clostridium estertheticum]|uniref:LacI family DNA-binding transcriptional regulator n=1 Tax=Clostridium estertheticum TaxID=238834 RepID=UPI001C0DA93F|nr:LacI family DNA-binding transcriptional regulator [Clostridium estertheticum]MBU3215155.1 LacI family DNA-binding transcriptional regulator [Clostridium estertheticum]WAG55557.1 LacI family DNA-binding transcriptional regulator [Clostridium estertheticum]
MKKETNLITISDVAKASGVSKTTVSRYLNGKFEYMSEDTGKRIQGVIEEYQYRPSNVAKTLKSNKSGLVGVIIADIASQSSSILLKGIGDVCTSHGYQVLISNVDNDPAKEREYIHSLMDNRVEGIIVNTTGYNEDFLVNINETRVPIVLADRTMDELKIDSVTTNNHKMTFDTIKFLVEKGYENIAFFTENPINNSVRLNRRQGYLDAMKELLNIDAEKLIYTINPADKKSCAKAIEDFNSLYKNNMKAIFTVNGVILLSVLKGIQQCNYKIPEDFYVCGYEDWGWATLVYSQMPVIAQDTYKIGVESAKMLIKRINGKADPKPRYKELDDVLIIKSR